MGAQTPLSAHPHMTDSVETIIVGAGVVGLAIARELAPLGSLLVLERESGIGTGTSSRNSEVIHAGMYYGAGTLKAETCVEGRRQLYDYCQSRGVPHRRTGKLIVATQEDQVEALRSIAARATANGLTTQEDQLQWLGGAEARKLEPALSCVAALWSPSTGIIDTHALMLSFLADAEGEGAMLAPRTEFVHARRVGHRWRVLTQSADGEYELDCVNLVNAAGLQAQRVAARVEGLAADKIPRPIWLKGSYFSLSGCRAPFSRLVYPVPSGGGLGVHLTLDLGGQARFGPDTEAVDPAWAMNDLPDYQVDPKRADRFYDAIRTYWPALPDGALQPAYSGIRPKIDWGVGGLDGNDFVISDSTAHGMHGLVNLFGIESPGITASLSLAARVRSALVADAPRLRASAV